MPELSATSESAAKNAITDWTISRHVFQCLGCLAWISAGVRIARVNCRWVCARCAGES